MEVPGSGGFLAFKKRTVVETAALSPLEATAAALREPIRIAARKIVPSVIGLSNADVSEAFRDRHAMLQGQSKVMPAVHADKDKRRARGAVTRWTALLIISDMQSAHPLMPTYRKVLAAADTAAPSGFLSRTLLDLCLSRTYGTEVARMWSLLVSALDFGMEAPAIDSLASVLPAGSPGKAAVALSLSASTSATRGPAVSPLQHTQHAPAGLKLPSLINPMDADLVAFLTTGAGKGKAGYVPSPQALARMLGKAALTNGRGTGVFATVAGQSAEMPTAAGKPPVLSSAGLQEMLAKVWADLWFGFSTPVTDSSPLAIAAGGAKLPGLPGLPKGHAVFDIRMFASAAAMLPALRKGMDVRVSLMDGIRVLASFASAPVGRGQAGAGTEGDVQPGDAAEGNIARQDLECLLALFLYRRSDVTALLRALDLAFVESLVSHHGNGYPARPESRIFVHAFRERVLHSTALAGWIQCPDAGPSVTVQAILHSAKLRREGKSAQAQTQDWQATVPITGLERHAVPALAQMIHHKKMKKFRVAAAIAFHTNKVLKKHFMRLREFSNRSRSVRISLHIAMAAYHQRTVDILRRPFSQWRVYAVRYVAAVHVQSAWRMHAAKGTIQILVSKAFVSRQLGKVWRASLVLNKAKAAKFAKVRAIVLLQRAFRGFRARKKTALIRMMQIQGSYYEARKKQAYAHIDLRRDSAMVVQRAFRRYKVTRKARSLLVRLREYNVHVTAVWAGRDAIEAWVAEQGRKRQVLDKDYPIPGSGKLCGSAQEWRVAGRRRKAATIAAREAREREDAVHDSFGVLQARQARQVQEGLQMPDAVDTTLHSYSLSAWGNAGFTPQNIGSKTGPQEARPRLTLNVQKILLDQSWVCVCLASLCKMVCGRAYVRSVALRRYERRYDVDANAYWYWDPILCKRLSRRPRALGRRHEIPVSDLWTARWDVRAPDAPHFFNMKWHTVVFDQPRGTLMCFYCDRSFVESYCRGRDCRTAACWQCFTGQHAFIADRHASLRESLWAAHPWLGVEGGTAGAMAAVAVLSQQGIDLASTAASLRTHGADVLNVSVKGQGHGCGTGWSLPALAR